MLRFIETLELIFLMIYADFNLYFASTIKVLTAIECFSFPQDYLSDQS